MLSLREICNRILNAYEGVRWVKIVDQEGKIVFEEKKSYVEPYLSEDAMKNLREFWIAVIQGIVGKLAILGSASTLAYSIQQDSGLCLPTCQWSGSCHRRAECSARND